MPLSQSEAPPPAPPAARPRVLIVGTADTKSDELQYLAGRV